MDEAEQVLVLEELGYELNATYDTNLTSDEDTVTLTGEFRAPERGEHFFPYLHSEGYIVQAEPLVHDEPNNTHPEYGKRRPIAEPTGDDDE